MTPSPHPLLVALQFLTRLPVRLATPPDGVTVGRSLPWYPLVGGVIAALLGMLALVFSSLPPLVAAFLLLIAWVTVTGGLHLDGLADSADAWMGGHDRARALAIMKDPACGPAGVMALVLALGLKAACLEAIMTQQAWSGLLLAPVLGRVMLVALLLTTPYVREHGLGSDLSRHAPRLISWLAVIVTMLALLLLAGAPVLLVAILLFALLRRLMLQRLGGTTGDTAGALVELTESTALAGLLWS